MLLTIVFFFLGILLVLFQTTIMQVLPGAMARPDLVFLLVAYCAYKIPWIPGIIVVFTMGWVMDVLVGVELGAYPLQFLCVFLCLKLVTFKSFVKETAYQIPLVGVSYFFIQMIVYFFSSLAIEHRLPEWSWGNVLQETLLLVLAAIPCFVLFNSLQEYLAIRIARSRPTRRRAAKHFQP